MQRRNRRLWPMVAGMGILALGYMSVVGSAGTSTFRTTKPIGERPVDRNVTSADVGESLPVEFLRQTFQIRTTVGTGTAFTVEVDDRQYIVTASHVIGAVVPSVVDIQSSVAGWRSVPVSEVALVKPPTDVAVLATNFMLGARSRVPVGVGTIGFGQPVRFLGFPFGLDFTPVPGVRTEPLPFIKAGILSGLRPVPGQTGLLELYVDAAGNPGFSGGPLVVPRLSTGGESTVTWHIAGVVTSGVNHRVPLKDKAGTTVGYFNADAGILRATSIDAVTRLIRANPVGYPLVQ